MNTSKLYIPNPQKWVNFYRNLAEGKVKLHSYNQTGGGNVTHSFIAPIERKPSDIMADKNEQPQVKLVTPSQQIVEQAKSELKRGGETIKGLYSMKKNQKSRSYRKGKSSIAKKKSQLKKNQKRKVKIKKRKSKKLLTRKKTIRSSEKKTKKRKAIAKKTNLTKKQKIDILD